jgi:hypothetical protein
MIADILIMAYKNKIISNNTIFGALAGAASVFLFNNAARGSLVKSIVNFTNGLPSYFPYKILGGGFLGSFLTSAVMIYCDKHPMYAAVVRPSDYKTSLRVGIGIGLASWLFVPAWKYHMTTALISAIISSFATNSFIEKIKDWRITKTLVGTIQGSDLIDLNGEILSTNFQKQRQIAYVPNQNSFANFFESEDDLAELLEKINIEGDEPPATEYPIFPSVPDVPIFPSVPQNSLPNCEISNTSTQQNPIAESFLTLADSQEMELHGFIDPDSKEEVPIAKSVDRFEPVPV